MDLCERSLTGSMQNVFVRAAAHRRQACSWSWSVPNSLMSNLVEAFRFSRGRSTFTGTFHRKEVE